ncbi:hypothetical protein [Bradyrhizobium sp. dw_78]|uniref:hypothetical protein n=1 Tax=Bradyrhizobium sp. dw_78 TaxID=2719793 RepID=UPI001BD2477E|nr:hypothetical protein [Bradyrhizobium sp. dw_78]
MPYKHRSGAPYNGAANVYYVPASVTSNIYVGDPVITANADNDANGIPGVILASAGASSHVTGVVLSVVNAGQPIITVTQDKPVYHPANTAGYVLVADDPELLFLIQDDGTGSAQANWASQNANLVSGTGNTATGWSGWQLAGSTVADTATLQLRIQRPLTETDNDITSANAKWLVSLNLHQVLNPAGT